MKLTHEESRLRNIARVSKRNRIFTKRNGERNLCVTNSPVLMTHSEVAKQLGITRQCVQQTERRAIHKLRVEIMKFYGGNPFLVNTRK